MYFYTIICTLVKIQIGHYYFHLNLSSVALFTGQ